MKRFVMAAALLLAVAACGGGSDGGDAGSDGGKAGSGSSDPTGSATPPAGIDLPSCTSTWKIGKTLPKDYQGCKADDDAFEAPVTTPDCVAVAYGESLWAVPGGRVTQSAGFVLDDPDFQAAC